MPKRLMARVLQFGVWSHERETLRLPSRLSERRIAQLGSTMGLCSDPKRLSRSSYLTVPLHYRSESIMYEKPTLVRFGSFRELTKGGSLVGNFDSAGDAWADFPGGHPCCS